MLWIGTVEDEKQLISVKTLKCMRLGGKQNGECVVARECFSGKAGWQKARCIYNSSRDGLKFKWNIRGNNGTKVDRYLNLESQSLQAIASTENSQLWSSKETMEFCTTSVKYKGTVEATLFY